MPPISACIITKNEEANLERCLQSLDFADEIILVDSGSTDRTLEIAKKYSARIFHRDFDAYCDQKNFASSNAKNEWIFSIDADEVVSPDLKNEILGLSIEAWNRCDGFSLPRLTYYLNQWIYHGGWYPNRQIRLFKKSKGKFEGYLHEKVHLESNVKVFNHPIYHFTYKNIHHHLTFIDRYSTLFAEQSYQAGKRSGIFKAFYKASFKFFWMYFGRMGFLDGKMGLVLAVLGFYYNFLKYFKLYEIEATQKSVLPLLVVVDPIHDVESQETTHKDGNQIHI